MPELASEERIAALEAENARLLAVCQEICRLLTDNEEHSYGEIYTSAVDGLKGDDSALKAMLDAARDEGRRTAEANIYSEPNFDPCRERDSLRAQLAERDEQLAKAKADGWCDVCCGKGDPGTGHPCICGGSGLARDAMHGLRIELADQIDRGCSEQLGRDQLAAQVERYREALQYEYDTSNMDRPLSDPQTIHNLLAETPEQSLAAIREQARREALEEAAREADVRAAYMVELAIASSSNAIKCCRLADGKQWELRARWLRELAAQPAKELRS